MIPQFRYASTLKDSISTSSSTITATSKANLEGSDGGTATSPIAVGSFVRLLKPNPSVAGGYIAEVMEVTGVSTVGATLVMTVGRADASFTGYPLSGDQYKSGTWVYGGSTVDVTETAGTNYSFEAGTVIENLNSTALLRNTTSGATADDYYLQVAQGNVNFVNTGTTGAGTYKVNSGMTVSAFFSYKTSAAKRIKLGKKQANLEYIVELEHLFPDDREILFHFHRCAVTPENTDFEFSPADFMSTELTIEPLASTDPAHVDEPFGYVDLENDQITLEPVTDATDTYTIGTFKMFLTPTNTARALARGIPTTRFTVGNVKTGGIRNPRTYVEHLTGIPQKLDKKIGIRTQFALRATIDEVNAVNLALLFDGNISDKTAGYAALNTLITVSAAPDAPLSLADVVYPLNALVLNPA